MIAALNSRVTARDSARGSLSVRSGAAKMRTGRSGVHAVTLLRTVLRNRRRGCNSRRLYFLWHKSFYHKALGQRGTRVPFPQVPIPGITHHRRRYDGVPFALSACADSSLRLARCGSLTRGRMARKIQRIRSEYGKFDLRTSMNVRSIAWPVCDIEGKNSLRPCFLVTDTTLLHWKRPSYRSL